MDKKFPVCVVRFRPAGRLRSCRCIACRFSARTCTSTPTSFRRKAIACWSAPRRWKPKFARSWAPAGKGGNATAAALVGKRVAEKEGRRHRTGCLRSLGLSLPWPRESAGRSRA